MSEVVYQSESADRAWVDRLPHAPARYAAGVLGLAGLYYAGAKTGYLLEFSGPVAAIVWLPVGIGVAFLYLGGLAYWPGVLIGDLLANDYSVLPFGSALGQTCGNILEVVIAVLLLRRLVRHGSPLASPRGVGAIAVSVATGAAVSATVGATSLLSGGVIGVPRRRDRLAHVVARRRHRRAARRAARAGLVPAAAEGLAPRALARGCRAPGGRRRAGRLRLAKLDPGHVPGLPAADLGRASLRAARRNARRRHHRGLHRLERDALPRPVPLRVGHAQRPQHAALHRRRSALDAQPGRGRQRARALRLAARRLPGRA